jgi:hypothetical protein
MSVLMEFTSHIAGKNARVAIHPDRIEWEQEGRITMTRALGGALVTGSLRKGGSTEMIPVRAITSVTTKKDGLRNWSVSIIAPGNSIDMRVSKDEAEQIKATLLQLMTAA